MLVVAGQGVSARWTAEAVQRACEERIEELHDEGSTGIACTVREVLAIAWPAALDFAADLAAGAGAPDAAHALGDAARESRDQLATAGCC